MVNRKWIKARAHLIGYNHFLSLLVSDCTVKTHQAKYRAGPNHAESLIVVSTITGTRPVQRISVGCYFGPVVILRCTEENELVREGNFHLNGPWQVCR